MKKTDTHEAIRRETRLRRGPAAGLAALLGLSCSSSPHATPASSVMDGGGNDGGGKGGSSPTLLSPLVFSPCPLRNTEPFAAPPSGPVTDTGFNGSYSSVGEWLAMSKALPDMAAAMAECATAKVPAVWSDPSGDPIDVFVKRYPAAERPAKGQLWLLEGGPGYPSATFEHVAFLVAKSIPTFDIYMPDHRGTGKSTLAQCPTSVPPSGCPAAIPHLDGLTTTGDALDLAALIDAVHSNSQQVFVYGVSYGTYRVERYLQVRPDQPTAAILDSTVPIGMDFAEFDRNFDTKTRAVLALCQGDATCSAKLGADPVAKAEQLLAATDLGACASWRTRLGDFVGNSYFDRLLLPATLYRARRCTAADQAWLQRVGSYITWQNIIFSAGYSSVVHDNVVVSEFWHTNKTAAGLSAEEATMIGIEGSNPGNARAAEYWPKYPLDSYYGKWPSSPAPTLVLQGGLDPRTPYGDIVKAHYSGKNQYYVEMPLAAHWIASPNTTPMVDPNAPGCGWQVILSFLADPTKPPDTSCIAGMAPLDFGNPPPEWMAVVGIKDLWENP
jgi:pimeloyl-ACP methyl ester carboxylesterase